jgi:hypothetical protein
MIIIAAAAMLAGCASTPQQRYGYGATGEQYGYGAPGDPSQWRVVSVTPVPPGTGARVAANSPDGSRVEYSSAPVTSPVYVPQPVYVPAPIYAPQPSYYYPPVSLSLGFVFGRHWSSGGRYRGHHGRRHR